MNSTQKKRLGLIAGGLIICGAAAALVFNAFEENLVFFFSPSQVAAHEVTVRFEVTDTAHTVPVTYKGSLPDLFKEGKGVVAQGKLQNGVFVADQVLAKHDENYMPPEAEKAVQDAHKKARAMKE